jgi:hypothetical protein
MKLKLFNPQRILIIMTDTTNSVDAAIAAAKQRQADQANLPANTSAPVPGASTAVAPAGARPQKLTLAALQTGGLQVDEFLKVNAFGLIFGKFAQTLLKEVTVDIDMSKVQVTESIKFGNPAQYLKTYDGGTCATGGTWAQAVERAQKADPKARTYPSADITMVLAAPVSVGAGAEAKTFPVGTKLGHSLSTTNRTNFTDLMDKMAQAGFEEGASVRVSLGHEYRNKGSNTWGLVTFTLIGRSADAQANAA